MNVCTFWFGWLFFICGVCTSLCSEMIIFAGVPTLSRFLLQGNLEAGTKKSLPMLSGCGFKWQGEESFI